MLKDDIEKKIKHKKKSNYKPRKGLSPSGLARLTDGLGYEIEIT